jgi:hypothetical protein
VTVLALGHLAAGQHEAAWNGLGADGQPVASGVYLYELDALGVKHAMRMTLVK